MREPSVQGQPASAVSLVPVWDLPVRLVHWLLLPLIIASWVTAENEMWEIHIPIGLSLLALVLFRLIWGVVGSETARFRGFVKPPSAALEHLRLLQQPGPMAPHIGHNALGGWSVVVLLGLLIVQTVTGLFLSGGDIILVTAPLNGFVSSSTESLLKDIHGLNFNLLQGLVLLHIGAVSFYWGVKKLNLVLPMVTGQGILPSGATAPKLASIWRALLVALAVFILVGLLSLQG